MNINIKYLFIYLILPYLIYSKNICKYQNFSQCSFLSLDSFIKCSIYINKNNKNKIVKNKIKKCIQNFGNGIYDYEYNFIPINYYDYCNNTPSTEEKAVNNWNIAKDLTDCLSTINDLTKQKNTKCNKYICKI